MKLAVARLVLGPLGNNVYVLTNEDTSHAVVIDPSFEVEKLMAYLARRAWKPTQIWLTHAHFDHTAGAAAMKRAYQPALPIAIHPASFAWAAAEGREVSFSFSAEPLPGMDIPLADRQVLSIDPGEATPVAEVRDVPGHNPGSVIFYVETLALAFVGDAIFRGSIGRTDLPGGDYPRLLQSIREQIFSLPDETILLPGHGPESSVGFEKRNNPYLA